MEEKSITPKKILVMVSIILGLIMLMYVAALMNPAVEFRDENLEAAILQKLNMQKGPIYRTDLIHVKDLDASGFGIKSIEGIQHLSRLSRLILDNNFIEDVSPLSESIMLQELSLANNGIISLEEAGFLSLQDLHIRRLNLGQNKRTSVDNHSNQSLSDISLLSKFQALEQLDLRENQIEDISVLSNLVHLKVLQLRQNMIHDLSPLQDLINLQKLNLRGNQLKYIDHLSALSNLVYLNINYNDSIVSVAPLAGLVKLENLYMNSVPVGNQIGFLAGLSNLIQLHVRNCNIEDTEVIGELMANGALQNDWANDKFASVDVRDNKPVELDSDPYASLRPYWRNVLYSSPGFLPLPLSSLSPPVFSHRGGFYTNAFTLTLGSDDPDVEIYYTLDGSMPDPDNIDGTLFHYKNRYPENSGDFFGKKIAGTFRTLLYREAVSIDDRSKLPDQLTHISSTNTRNITYFPSRPVFKGTVVRAIAIKNGVSSPEETHTYFVSKKGKQRYSLPVVSIAVQVDDFFDYDNGIYVAGVDFDNWRKNNPYTTQYWNVHDANFKRRHEVPVHVEFYKSDGSLGFSQHLGLRIHGSSTRERPLKSLRLYARMGYDEVDVINYPFFDESEELPENDPNAGAGNDFKRILLRNSGQDWNDSFFRDALVQHLIADLNLETQAYSPSIVFINGEYWGIHNLRERYDRFYFQRVYGIQPDEIDFLVGNGFVDQGDSLHYAHTIEYLKANDIRADSVYQWLETRIDIANYQDYVIANIYSANTDWPGANISFWRKKTDTLQTDAPYGHDGRWRWMAFDMDAAFSLRQPLHRHNTFQMAIEEGKTEWPNPDWSTFLLRTLLKNQSFRTRFINRFSDLLNTYFTPSRIHEVIDSFMTRIEPEMDEHIKRWKNPKSLKQWYQKIDIMHEFVDKRPENVRRHIAEILNLDSLVEISLNVSDADHGYIRINSIDLLPQTPGMDGYPWKAVYFEGIPVEVKAIAKPGYTFSHWEGLNSDRANVTLNPAHLQSVKACFVRDTFSAAH